MPFAAMNHTTHVMPLFPLRHCFTVCCLVACCLTVSGSEKYPERARDQLIVETVLRLENFDLSSSEKARSAVLRYLQHNVGSERFFELIRRFQILEANPLLIQLAAAKPTETAGVEAARLLLRSGQSSLLLAAIDRDDKGSAGVITAVGLSGEPQAAKLFLPLISEKKRSLAVRRAATQGLGRQQQGQKQLLKLVAEDKLPEDLRFTAGNILRGSADATIRQKAHQLLPPPASSDAEPLPPLAELITQRGNLKRGRKIFLTRGSCANCHRLNGQGKEVGPDLSEIGSKLSREAMYVAILDPSAGISHNYETYQALLTNGTVFSGIKVSETDDAVTLKSAEALVRTIPHDEIDEIFKNKLSLMPAGLQKTMTVQQLVDLVEFLMSLKKTGS